MNQKKRGPYKPQIPAGLFPPPVKIGRRASAWPRSETEAVNAARIAGKGEDEIRALVSKLEAARKAAAQEERRNHEKENEAPLRADARTPARKVMPTTRSAGEGYPR
jgi:prophage regulatory protein